MFGDEYLRLEGIGTMLARLLPLTSGYQGTRFLTSYSGVYPYRYHSMMYTYTVKENYVLMPTPTPTGTDLQISTDASFSKIVNTDDGTYRTSQRFEKDALPYGQTLYARVRHKSAETGESNWSPTVTFSIVVPAQIIGVCMDNSNSSTKGTFYWIDALGNQLSSFDWQSHPCYSNISMVTVDSSRAPVTLTRFPLTYVKTAASGPAGSFANGKKCWWISDAPYIGFHPAACFKRSTSKQDGKYVIADYCYMGTFLGHQESAGGKTVIGSKRGQTVLASQTKATFKTYITNRNNTSAGITGFRMFDIWDLGLLRTLALVAKANSDTQSQWGDNSAGTSYPKTGSTNARMVFNGSHSDPKVSIEDLWRCYWYHADLITIDSGRVTLTSPMDLSSSLSFGSASSGRYTQPTDSGWIRDILDCPFTIGDDEHDLMELFLPKTVVSAENQGTFSDLHEVHNNTAFGCLRTGGQSYHCSNSGNSYTDPHVGGSFTSMVCENEGTGDCGAQGHWYSIPNLDGSRLSKN